VKLAREDSARRDTLVLRIAQFRNGAQRRGIALSASRTPIQPILIGPSDRALHLSAQLEAAGYFVPAIRPPTVAEHTARLRITLSAAHSESDVEGLLAAMAAAGMGHPS
jgi:8-amino-7-oxononanoate synthase